MPIPDFESLVKRFREKAAAEKQSAVSGKQGDACDDLKDPNDQGKKSAPSSESMDGQESKSNNPQSKGNAPENTEAGQTLENRGAGVIQPGESAGVSTSDGNASDKANEGGFKKASDEDLAQLGRKVLDNLRTKFAASKEDSAKEQPASEDKSAEAEGKTASGKSAEDNASLQSLSPEFHVKLASTILQSEEGVKYARKALAEQLGNEVAEELITKAEGMEKLAAEQDAELQRFQQIYDELPPEEKRAFHKSAAIHRKANEDLTDGLEKNAYDQGAMDAMAMAGGADPMVPGADAEPSLEEILMVLDQMVQAGELPPEVADAILAQLMGGAEGGAADPMAGGGMSPEEAALMGEVGKAASASQALADELTAPQK